MFKRGVSPVIATVLLLVITVVIASIIFAFVVPFVNKSLGNSKACLNVLDGVEFPESKFNCYVDYSLSNPPPFSSPQYETGFSVKVKKAGIVGVRISLIDEDGNSEVKDIKLGSVEDEANYRLVDSDYNAPLIFPSTGGQRSYVVNVNYSMAEISPITESGDVCAVSDTVEFTPCASDVEF